MSSRRDALSTIDFEKLKDDPNAGLWLDRFITTLDKEDKESRSKLAKQVALIHEPDCYEAFYRSWKDYLKGIGAVARPARVKNRLAIGLGADSVLETSMTLHRTYGVPYIPGSAIKGLAAAFARQYCGIDWQMTNPPYEVVFGSTAKAGYVMFLDALYVPKSGVEGTALHFDVMTVHHRGYYEGKGQPPADWDDPNPVPFLSATGEYLIALAAPEGCETWRDLAFQIMEEALKHEGVGAKTSSGYGRAMFAPPPVDQEQHQVEEMLHRIKSIPADKLPGELPDHAQKLLRSELRADNKKKVAEFIVMRVRESGKQRKKFEEKAWFAEVQKLIDV